MNNLKSVEKLLTILILSFHLISVFAYQQEFIFHENVEQDGNYYAFRKNLPDASKFPLQDVKKLCVRGSGAMYSTTNYTKFYTRFNSGGSRPFCMSWNFQSKPIAGFRFGGNTNASVNSLSLYSGTMWEGTETLIVNSTFQDIWTPVRSLMATGTGNWTLFESTDLSGNSTCWANYVDTQGRYVNFQPDILQLGISTVGSVRLGC